MTDKADFPGMLLVIIVCSLFFAASVLMLIGVKKKGVS